MATLIAYEIIADFCNDKFLHSLLIARTCLVFGVWNVQHFRSYVPARLFNRETKAEAMPSKKFIWTDKNIFKLIKEVEGQPSLWNKLDAKYMSKRMKHAAFEEIAESIGASPIDVREKVRNLRTNFFANYKKYQPGRPKPKWLFFNAMMYMAADMTTTDELDVHSPLPESDLEIEEVKSEHSSAESMDSSDCLPLPKRKRESSSEYEEVEEPRNELERDKGANEAFGFEIATILNNMHDFNLVRRTKARMRLVLAEAMAEEARHDLARAK